MVEAPFQGPMQLHVTQMRETQKGDLLVPNEPRGSRLAISIGHGAHRHIIYVLFGNMHLKGRGDTPKTHIPYNTCMNSDAPFQVPSQMHKTQK